jgi:hypothetical protein
VASVHLEKSDRITSEIFKYLLGDNLFGCLLCENIVNNIPGLIGIRCGRDQNGAFRDLIEVSQRQDHHSVLFSTFCVRFT